LEAQGAGNKVGMDVDKLAREVIMVGLLGVRQLTSARTGRKNKVNKVLTN
jgi:hypothetical protein